MTINTQTLDHIVHLTPPGSVQEASRQFTALGFKVLPGGVHAGGLTENALVVLDDGVYLELISFTHPQSHYPPGSPGRIERDKNPWAYKPPGWIDFAFLGNGSRTNCVSESINARARAHGDPDLYLPEQDGGRTRPDGKVLKWLISPPPFERRGILPFFCGDVTPRALRVPSEPPSNSEHPSTTKGVSFIHAIVSSASFTKVTSELQAVLGNSPVKSTDESATWELDTVSPGTRNPRLVVSIPATEEQGAFLAGLGSDIGIYEVGFRVAEGSKKGSGTTPYGRISWEP